MTVVLKIVFFILGLCLSVQVVGALFSLVDLRSELRRHWLLAARAILVWAGLAVIPVLILGETYRSAFVWGLGVYAVLYVGTFFGGQLLILRNRRLLDKD
jgi:hypothetical protein